MSRLAGPLLHTTARAQMGSGRWGCACGDAEPSLALRNASLSFPTNQSKLCNCNAVCLMHRTAVTWAVIVHSVAPNPFHIIK